VEPLPPKITRQNARTGSRFGIKTKYFDAFLLNCCKSVELCMIDELTVWDGDFGETDSTA
jgi:hypothetical protein